MSRSALEIDLPRPIAENDLSSKPLPQKLLERRRSFRDIQSGISKINPQLLKSLISSGSSVNKTLTANPSSSDNGNVLPSDKSFSVPWTPKEHHLNSHPAFPVFIPTLRPFSTSPETAALTIFYNGTVSVYDVPPHKAESIIKLALESHALESTDSQLSISSILKQQLLETLNRDQPIARRKSLQRFLEKRKERLTTASSNYDCTTTTKHPSSSAQNSQPTPLKID